MRSIPLVVLAAVVALFLPTVSMAVDIELVPSDIVVAVDSGVSVDVVISGLGEFAAPSLGAFDVVLEYDDTLFTFQDIIFGAELGDPDMLGALVTVNPMASQVQVIEASLLLPAALNGAQSDSFVLFTATFDAAATGVGVFDIADSAILSDELGAALTLDTVVPATVTVDLGQSVIDVPTLSEWGATALMFGLLFCGLLILRGGPRSNTALTALLCVLLLGTFGVAPPVAAVDGDLEPDGDVDLIDVQAIYGALGSNVGAGDPMDLDDDGVITVLDVRIAVACCNLAGCAVVNNQPPTLTAIADQTIDEDDSTGALAFTVADDNTDTAALTVSAVSSNQALIPDANLTLGGAGAARTIEATPVADASGGPVTITVTVDDGFLSTDETFLVTVDAVNDPPSFSAGADQVVAEDSGAQTVPSWATALSAGPADESGQTLTFNVTNNSNPALFSTAPAINDMGALSYTPAADANGSATVTIELVDNGGGSDTSASQSFDITVTALNDTPSFTAGADQTVAEDAGAQTVAAWATGISAGPADESGQALTFSVTNNTDSSLFSSGPAIDASGELSYTPAADANGTATITIELMDDGGGSDTSASQSFDITVTAVNDPPDFTVGADQTVAEDAGAQAVASWATGISAGPSDEGSQMLSFNVTNNSNPGLFAAAPSISASGELSYTPAADASGSATVTVELVDDGGGDDTSSSQSFDITVTAVNDTPSFTVGGDQTILEDAGAQTVSSWASGISAGPSDESGQALTFLVTNNTDPSLFSSGPSINASGELSYTPAADANGTATVTVALMDDGGGSDTSAGQSFDIAITAVNDAPSFTVGAGVFVNTNTEPLVQSIANFVTGISAGGVGEDGQTLTFTVTGNTNPAIFTTQPTIDSSGTLNFTIAFAANGNSNITVELSDDGGTANGGEDTAAAPQSFDIDISSPGR